MNIESVVVDGEKMPTDENLILGPGKVRLTIRYTYMSLQAGEKVRFKYRLEGMDNDWVAAGPNRVAEYTHLPPGTYRFRVSACNEDGVWNERGTAIGIELKPYFYQTFWFYAAGGLTLILCIVGVHLLRTRRLLWREQYLARCVDDAPKPSKPR